MPFPSTKKRHPIPPCPAANLSGFANPRFKQSPKRRRRLSALPIRRLAYTALVLPILLFAYLAHAQAPPQSRSTPAAETAASATEIRIARLVPGGAITQRYPNALPSLLQQINDVTTANVAPQPVIIKSFEDPRLFSFPFVYANFADRESWQFTKTEQERLREYLQRGGFLYIDAGITAEFLRQNPAFGQHHSFGEWQAHPDLQNAFADVLPGREFKPLGRSHDLFRVFYQGLPDPSDLPDTVRDFVIDEKWPDGTYSAVGLHVDDRLAVLATPIISMGWGRHPWGEWITTIGFRIREGAEGLSERLATAAYAGERFEVRRLDGQKDIIYCQQPTKPAWVQEPDGAWRVFRYYHSTEISDYAHVFYTRLGVNILVHALTH